MLQTEEMKKESKDSLVALENMSDKYRKPKT